MSILEHNLTKKSLILNNENYHSLESNQLYMSNSQYKDFRKCEAMAMAKVEGWWEEPESDALLVGSYVHAYFEGPEAFQRFRQLHPEIISSQGPTKGQLKATYRVADAMIETLASDPFCMFALEGHKEVIMIAEFAGTLWKLKLDSYNPDMGRISDIKTVKSIREKYWDPEYGQYVSFAESYRYITQMSLYTELERRYTGRDTWLEPLIVAVSKEDPPDKMIINIDEGRIRAELEEIESHMPRILQVKRGEVEPNRCEKCRYCRETKRLTKVVHYMDILEGA